MRGFPEQEDYAGLFDLAEVNGASVAVIRPLAGGALTDAILCKGSEGRHELSRGWYREHPEQLEPEISRARRFEFLRHGGTQTLSEAAYRYILSDTRVATIVGGFSDPAHLEEAARASDLGALGDDDKQEIAAIHKRGFGG